MSEMQKQMVRFWTMVMVILMAWCTSAGADELSDLKQRAENGEAEAQRLLGIHWVAQENFPEAMALFQKAADQGDMKALGWLGSCYGTSSVRPDWKKEDNAKATECYQKAMEAVQKMAEAGDAEAQDVLGACYDEDCGAVKDPQKAAEWFQKSAEQGYVWGQANLAGCYMQGTGVEKDPEKAMEWARKAAEQGNAIAQWKMGDGYLFGTGVPKDLEKAESWFRKAIDQGSSYGMFGMGCFCFESGKPEEAVEWMRKSAEKGNAFGRWMLGRCCLNGFGVEQNTEEGLAWLRKSTEQNCSQAMVSLAQYLLNSEDAKDADEAIRLLNLAAERKNTEAYVELGYCSLFGQGVEKNTQKALEWFQKGVEENDAVACMALARRYYDGAEDLPKDLTKAMEYYKKAAELGNPDGMNSYGICCELGIGRDVDKDEAVKWFTKAIDAGFVRALGSLGRFYHRENQMEKALEYFQKGMEKGDVDACMDLANLYFNGAENLPQDLTKAAECYKKAAELGDPEGMNLYATCCGMGVGREVDKEEALKWHLKAAEAGFVKALSSLGHFYIRENQTQKAIEYFQKGVEKGDADACMDLARLYYNGTDDLPKDMVKTVEYYKKAAELGNIEGMQNYALCSEMGLGRDVDKDEALKWYNKAVELGDVHALVSLGFFYFREKQIEKTIECFQKAAEKGDADACLDLARLYFNGADGLPKDWVKSTEYYKKAAELRSPEGMVNYGLCCELGDGRDVDKNEALKWYHEAVKLDYTSALISLGRFYLREEKPEKAVEYFRQADEKGEPEGAYCLGDCYTAGNGVDVNLEKAAEWYKKSAEGGYPEGMCIYACCLMFGQGAEKDEKAAFELFQKAVEAGNDEADVHLGNCYLFGAGVEADHEKAVECFRQAAEAGVSWGMLLLARCYENGIGVKQDKAEALRWLKKAVEQEDANAYCALAKFYLENEGEEKAKEAAAYYRKAVDMNDAEAMAQLGILYLHGIGVEEDSKQAVQLFKKAADMNEPEGQYQLGLYCLLDKDEAKQKEGKEWLKKAADQGHEDAKAMLEMNE